MFKQAIVSPQLKGREILFLVWILLVSAWHLCADISWTSGRIWVDIFKDALQVLLLGYFLCFYNIFMALVKGDGNLDDYYVLYERS